MKGDSSNIRTHTRNQQDSRSHQGLQIDAQEVRGDSTNIRTHTRNQQDGRSHQGPQICRMCPDHRPHVMNYHQGEEHPSEQGFF